MGNPKLAIIGYVGNDGAFIKALIEAAEGLGDVDAVSVASDAHDPHRFDRAGLLIVDIQHRCGSETAKDALLLVTSFASRGKKVAVADCMPIEANLLFAMEAGAISCLDKSRDYFALNLQLLRILHKLPARGAWPPVLAKQKIKSG
ncbi:MAG: hypothetical protein AAB486_04875 [Patescibacteria group bacterium]